MLTGGRGGLGHVNVSKKPPRSMRTNCDFNPPSLNFRAFDFQVSMLILTKKAIRIEIVFGSLYVLVNFQKFYVLEFRISLNFTIAWASFLSLVKVAILIVHDKKGHGIFSLGSEPRENIKN